MQKVLCILYPFCIKLQDFRQKLDQFLLEYFGRRSQDLNEFLSLQVFHWFIELCDIVDKHVHPLTVDNMLVHKLGDLLLGGLDGVGIAELGKGLE